MRKTKIICTLGPATKDDEVLKQLMENGMDVARINFSHGSQAEHKVTMDRVKKMRKELGRPVGILLDIPLYFFRLFLFLFRRSLIFSAMMLIPPACSNCCRCHNAHKRYYQ